MNKISNHLLRSLNSSIPAGTECYLCDAVRRALLNYRNGFEPVRKIIDSSEAISLINYRLNNGLKRFFKPTVQNQIET
jgi:hypothetical protein